MDPQLAMVLLRENLATVSICEVVVASSIPSPPKNGLQKGLEWSWDNNRRVPSALVREAVRLITQKVVLLSATILLGPVDIMVHLLGAYELTQSL